jgi:hypothetical protein
MIGLWVWAISATGMCVLLLYLLEMNHSGCAENGRLADKRGEALKKIQEALDEWKGEE